MKKYTNGIHYSPMRIIRLRLAIARKAILCCIDNGSLIPLIAKCDLVVIHIFVFGQSTAPLVIESNIFQSLFVEFLQLLFPIKSVTVTATDVAGVFVSAIRNTFIKQQFYDFY